MKHTLTLTGSSAALAAAMQAFEAVEGKAQSSSAPQPTPSTSTGTGTPVAPAMPSAPSGATPMPTAPIPTNGMEDEEGDDDGPAGDGEGVDSDGLPWDERIHSSNKQKSANGKWMKRRGGPKGAELAAIEAELRAALQQQPGDPAAANGAQPSAPMPTAAPPPPMPTSVPNSVEVSHVAPAPMPMPTAGPTPTPPMPTATVMPAVEQSATPAMPAAAAPAGLDFPSLMQQIGPKMGEGEGQINAAYLQVVCQTYGLGSLTDLALKPEMIDQIVAQFVADGRW